jgi:aspartyl-tRNA(Asn)/glutamyl-tRNA(Gln) amidotransferase subunit C
MITIQDIDKLANLSRLALTEQEKASFSNEIGAILGYVANINTLAGDIVDMDHAQINVLRDDMVIHQSGEYSKNLLANAPSREGDYVKVKKILGGE